MNSDEYEERLLILGSVIFLLPISLMVIWFYSILLVLMLVLELEAHLGLFSVVNGVTHHLGRTSFIPGARRL